MSCSRRWRRCRRTSCSAALDQLAEAGLVFRRGDPPDAVYTFKHALVQETAYNTLLRARREEIHGRIARTLASDFPDVMEANPELIANHYTQAGLDEEAVEFWREAGDLAIARCAPDEAIAHLGNALAILESFRRARIAAGPSSACRPPSAAR